MYAYFKGKVEIIYIDKIILDVNNIGYDIYMPESEILKLSQDELKVYTYLHVREDEMKLFGFLSIETLEFFKKLISVSGVGPKVALGIISNISVSDMCIAIATEDIAQLRSVPGIGPKMAQKIIFELKDKVVQGDLDKIKEGTSKVTAKNVNINEALTALQVLGYAQKQVKEVISKFDITNESVEDIIKMALKEMQNI